VGPVYSIHVQLVELDVGIISMAAHRPNLPEFAHALQIWSLSLSKMLYLLHPYEQGACDWSKMEVRFGERLSNLVLTIVQRGLKLRRVFNVMLLIEGS
jgi:hypothetical protein